MISQLLVAVTALLSASVVAQEECDCALQLFPPFWEEVTFPVWIHLFPAAALGRGCGERGNIACEAFCSSQGSQFLRETDFNSPKPEDESARTWGQYMCDTAIESNPIEMLGRRIDWEIDVYGRSCSNDAADWEYLYWVEDKYLCCDVLGFYDHDNCVNRH